MAGAGEIDWPEEFPGLRERVYLNSAAESLGSRTLAAALQRYAEAKMQGATGREAMYAAEAACRQRVAALLGCTVDEVAFLASTTEAINTVLVGLRWEPGDNVVITDLEFPSAVIAALHLGKRLGVDVRVARQQGGALPVEAIARLVDRRTRLVALSHVSFRTGYRSDLDAVADCAHAQGALVLVDAAQSLGAVRVPAEKIDFLAACTFKWLLGNHGLSVLYVRRERMGELDPPYVGWRSVKDYFSAVPTLRYEMVESAQRFETGMLDYAAIFALHDALGLRERLGGAAVEARVLALSGRLVAGLQALGVQPLTPAAEAQRAGIVAFESPRYAEIGAALEARRIFAWCKDGRVRASAHVYNSEADVGAFCEGVAAALRG